MTFGLQGEGIQGATLVFVTLPEVFMQMPGTQFWSVMFFLLLTVAALTSTISISEVSVAFIRDRFGTSRRKAVLIVMLPLFVLSSLCSLSQGALSDVTLFGKNIFDFLDYTATNIFLPLVSIGLCVWLGWFAPVKLIYDEVGNGKRSVTVSAIRFIIRFVAPILIAIVFLFGII